MSDATDESQPNYSRAIPDALGRPVLADGMKRQIDEAFRIVPEGKRAAVLVIHDFETQQTRAHLAARFGDHWKVAGGPGWDWDGDKPTGWVGVMWSK